MKLEDFIKSYLNDKGIDFDFIQSADLKNFSTNQYIVVNNDLKKFDLVEFIFEKKDRSITNANGKITKEKYEVLEQHKVIESFNIDDMTSVNIDKFALSRVYHFSSGQILRVNGDTSKFDNYLKFHQIPIEFEDRKWYNKIIGFRSGTPWKMVVSMFAFIVAFSIFLTVLPNHIASNIGLLISLGAFLGIIFFFVAVLVNGVKRKRVKKQLAGLLTSIFLVFFSLFAISANADPIDNSEENLDSKVVIKKEDKKTVEKLTTEKPTTEKPTTEEPVTEKPKKEEPKKEEPKKEKTITKKKTEENKKGTVARFPVILSKTVDGDTAYFYNDEEEIKARFLLIDTPETKHPRIGVQPFGPEASSRTAELLNNALNIEIEYDVGDKQDHYGRDLVYVYVDGKMVNEILVREGLAQVSYVYPPNTRYEDTLRKAEELAKAEKIGIWSLDSAFGEVEEVVTTEVPKQTVEQPTTSEFFSNCTELNAVYPGGVPLGHPAYQGKMDRDKDNFACEKN